MKCPHGCTDKPFVFVDCATNPGAVPEEGDVGMCYTCGGWWTIQSGQVIQYTPSPEELSIGVGHLDTSRKRFEQRYGRSRR